MTDNYIVLDTETTGLNPARDKVLEIGAARIEQGRVVETFETLIDTGVPIPERITELLQRLWKEFGEKEPDAFAARPMQYSAKKQSPITDSQKGYLNDLLKYHRIDTNIRIEDMTKSEASRMIDKIILNYGRMPKSGRRTG